MTTYVLRQFVQQYWKGLKSKLSWKFEGTYLPLTTTLTGQQQCVGQGGKHGHENRPEQRMETWRLCEAEVCISEPNLDHQPGNGLQGPVGPPHRVRIGWKKEGWEWVTMRGLTIPSVHKVKSNPEKHMDAMPMKKTNWVIIARKDLFSETQLQSCFGSLKGTHKTTTWFETAKNANLWVWSYFGYERI